VGCFSYKLYRLFQTQHSFSVTIFTLGFRLFFILLQINLEAFPSTIHNKLNLVFFNTALANELPEESEQFRFLRAACFANIKGWG
jgi:hypothetical protein